MSVLDELGKRIRPGSRQSGPISQTFLTRRGEERRAPAPGMSAPGANRSVEGQSWPVVMAREIDSKGMETMRSLGRGIRQLLGQERPLHEQLPPEDPTGFGRYEPDDPAVMAKLFGVRLDD